ncbi:hypothetical protein ACLKA6_018929 [Drosophila palustris]
MPPTYLCIPEQKPSCGSSSSSSTLNARASSNSPFSNATFVSGYSGPPTPPSSLPASINNTNSSSSSTSVTTISTPSIHLNAATATGIDATPVLSNASAAEILINEIFINNIINNNSETKSSTTPSAGTLLFSTLSEQERLEEAQRNQSEVDSATQSEKKQENKRMAANNSKDMVSPWLVSSESVSAPKGREPTIIRKSVITTQL